MKIAICVKQVPNKQDDGMNFVTGNLDRKILGVATNPYDLVAIESGLKIKDELNNTTIDVYSMGPKRAEEAIRESYTLGVDNGFLISDNEFSGADVLATAYTIANSIKNKNDYDLIICGKQTTDGDTGQVGASISVFLTIPYINSVSEIVETTQTEITVKQDLGTVVHTIKCKYPCLISVEKDICTPRLPSLKLKMNAKKKEVKHISLDETFETQSIGVKGSPTRVKKIYRKKLSEKKDVMDIPLDEAKRIIYEVLGRRK